MQMVEFVQFVYHQLNNQNFDHLGFIEEAAFTMLTRFLLYHIETGTELANAIGDGVDKMKDWWSRREAEIEDSEVLARQVLSNPKILRFTTPEAKGAMLFKLTKDHWFYREELQEDAVLMILSWVQTQREFQEVCEHMTEDGTKSRRSDPYQVGYDRIVSLLDGEQYERFLKRRSEWRRSRLRDELGKTKSRKAHLRTNTLQKIALYPVEPKTFVAIQQTFKPGTLT